MNTRSTAGLTPSEGRDGEAGIGSTGRVRGDSPAIHVAQSAVFKGKFNLFVKKHFPSLVEFARDHHRYGRNSSRLARRHGGVTFVPILGMHRSGTSCVTRILAANGLHLGDDLVAANAHNEEGFWESAEAIAINDTLLKTFNAGYLDPPESLNRFPTPLFSKSVAYLSGLARAKVVGWKDPRTTVTWPAWQEVLSKSDYRIVACFRHPGEVSRSLMAIYEGMTEEQALEIWSRYNRSLLGIAGPVTWVNFNEPLDGQIPGVCNALGLEYNPSSLSLYKTGLVHNRNQDFIDRPSIRGIYGGLLGIWQEQHALKKVPTG